MSWASTGQSGRMANFKQYSNSSSWPSLALTLSTLGKEMAHLSGKGLEGSSELP